MAISGKTRIAVTGIASLVGQNLLQALAENRQFEVLVVEVGDVEEEWLDAGHVLEVVSPDDVDWPRCAALIVAAQDTPDWCAEATCPIIGVWPAGGAAEALAQGVTSLLTGLREQSSVQSVQATVMWPMAVEQQPGIEELATQTASLLNGRGAKARLFPRQVAFNLSLGAVRKPSFGQALQQQLAGVHCAAVEGLAPTFFGVAVALHVTTTAAVDLDGWRQSLVAHGVQVAGKGDVQSLVDDVSGQGQWVMSGLYANGLQCGGWFSADLARTVLVESALVRLRQQTGC